MPEVYQKFIDNFSFLISIVEPKWSKNFFTFLLGGQIGIGPSINEIGGRGIALTIFALILIAFFNWDKLIVEIKLIMIWLDLNLSSLIILFPTFGVIDKNTQLQLSTIFWLSLAISTFLNFF